MSVLDPILDVFRGKAVTIPPMDGALKPNTALDEAEVVAAAVAPDNLAVLGGQLVYSSGHEIRHPARHDIVGSFAAEVTALAIDGDGTMAVGLDDGTVMVGARKLDGFTCPTALAFHGGDLFICNGSAALPPSQWVSDLMHRNASGSVWRVDVRTGQRARLADGLAFPNGVVVDAPQNRLVVSESWRHRLVAIPLAGGRAAPVLQRLPAYPSRLSAAGDGFLLCLFAPLNRLVEFVLQEDAYRVDMMRHIESRFWIAPTLAPAASFLEPLQNGGVRSMGVHKPWSPTRSYGLVARLDRAFQPVESHHSRASGRFHGITSAIEQAGAIVATSKGGNHIIRVMPGGGA